MLGNLVVVVLGLRVQRIEKHGEDGRVVLRKSL
jgi:hypothetical protein